MRSSSSRITWIDIARCIGIVFVVLGHTSLVNYIALKWIFTFHMPLFFIISGYCYKKKTFSKYLLNRIKTLCLPYLCYSLVYLIIDIIIFREFVRDKLIYRIREIILGKNELLWFLVALFITELMYRLIDLLLQSKVWRRIAIFGVFCLGLLFSWMGISLPFRLHTALIMLPFFDIGRLLKEINLYSDRSWKKFFMRLPIWLIISLISTFINQKVNVRTGEYGNIVLFFVGGIAGTLIVFEISRIIEKCIPLEVVGRNTMCIYALNEYVPLRLAVVGGVFEIGIVRKIMSVIVLILALIFSEYKNKLKKNKSVKSTQ